MGRNFNLVIIKDCNIKRRKINNRSQRMIPNKLIRYRKWDRQRSIFELTIESVYTTPRNNWFPYFSPPSDHSHQRQRNSQYKLRCAEVHSVRSERKLEEHLISSWLIWESVLRAQIYFCEWLPMAVSPVTKGQLFCSNLGLKRLQIKKTTSHQK